MTKHRQNQQRAVGTHVIWPSGLERRYNISTPTRWRWERDGKLPRRDFFIAGKAVGWRPETLEAAERGETMKAVQ